MGQASAFGTDHSHVHLFAQFLAPFIMVKKGGKLPEGNINDWFFEKGDLKSSLPGRLPPGAGIDLGGYTAHASG